MKKCRFCGKEYIRNPNIIFFPEVMRANLEFIPNCDCQIKHDMKIQNKIWEENLKKSRLKNILMLLL